MSTFNPQVGPRQLPRPDEGASTPTLTTAGGYVVSISGSNDLVVQLNHQEVLRIQLGANMKITCTDTLEIEAKNISISANDKLKFKSGSSTDWRASSNISINAGFKMDLKALDVSVRGMNVNLNEG